MSKRYGIFFAVTGPLAERNYLPDCNTLLNSIQKTRLWEWVDGELDVNILHLGFDPAWRYFERARNNFEFNIQEFNLEHRNRQVIPNGVKTNELVKRARYFHIKDAGLKYDAVCLLDADMFFVSPEFGSFFQMVSGTSKLIGANERFKWDVGPESYFEADGTPIFPASGKLHSMICNVPSVFDMHQWQDVFEYYCKICFDGYQIKNGQRVGIGDLFAHNIAIHKLGRASDVVMLPMESMAQVHHVWRKPWTHLINDNGNWRSWAGDRVYMIHDTKRICQGNFISGNMAEYRKEFSGWDALETMAPKIEAGLRAVQREWWNLNYGSDSNLKLSEFINNKEWEEMYA